MSEWRKREHLLIFIGGPRRRAPAVIRIEPDLAQQVRATTEDIAHEAADRLSDVKQNLSLPRPNGAGNRTHYSAEAPEMSSRQADRALLGIAGLAVAAALGIALQRRAEYER